MSHHHAETRKIYEKQHDRVAADQTTMDRIYSLYEDDVFGVEAKWFSGKDVLDAGCGNVGLFMVRMAELGVRKVYGIDIGSDWMEKLRRSLSSRKVPADKYELKPGSVLEIPYEGERFDFVTINGVLIHLQNIPEIMKGFAEGVRVCKKGGYYCTVYGPCGGLIQGAIFPAIRQYYRQNREFKKFIDTISPEIIHSTIDKICVDARKHTGEDLHADFLKALFGVDFCVFLQNYIQAPSWLSNECTPEFVKELYKAHGFKNIVRVNKFVKRSDVRKYFAPLHYDWDHPVSRVLYGQGYVQYVGQKD